MKTTDKYILDYFFIPIILIPIYILLFINYFENDADLDTIITIVLLFFALLAYSYEVGYKKYYLRGKKKYFLIVFISPIILSVFGLLIGK